MAHVLPSSKNPWQFRTRCSPEITRFFIRPPRTPCSSGSSSCGFGGINIDRFPALFFGATHYLKIHIKKKQTEPGLMFGGQSWDARTNLWRDLFFSLDVMTRVTGKSPIEFDDFPSEVSLHGGFPITMFGFQRVSLLFMCGVDIIVIHFWELGFLSKYDWCFPSGPLAWSATTDLFYATASRLFLQNTMRDLDDFGNMTFQFQ